MRLSKIFLFSLLCCFVFPISSNADQLEDAKIALGNENFEKAYELLSPLAENGNAEAQNILGSMYVNGQGLEQDATKGLSWIMKAANQGHEGARKNAYMLCYDEAEQGNMGAMHNLAYMCLNGWIEGSDTSKCLKLLEGAAINGFTPSAKALCKIYREGMYGVDSDEGMATYWENFVAESAEK